MLTPSLQMRKPRRRAAEAFAGSYRVALGLTRVGLIARLRLFPGNPGSCGEEQGQRTEFKC